LINNKLCFKIIGKLSSKAQNTHAIA